MSDDPVVAALGYLRKHHDQLMRSYCFLGHAMPRETASADERAHLEEVEGLIDSLEAALGVEGIEKASPTKFKLVFGEERSMVRYIEVEVEAQSHEEAAQAAIKAYQDNNYDLLLDTSDEETHETRTEVLPR